ncbi:MAG TPA: stage V sporulation protein B [Bacillales bacterium]|nr:stage V sporulation protein B [Bacillales bacterium]
MTKQSFLKGTLVLILAGIVVKIIGFINKIVIVRIIGEEGYGLFTMAFPTLLLTVTLTQIGLPVAISKLVSEAEALNDRRKIKRILVVSLSTTGTLSLLFTGMMILFAPMLAKTVFVDERVMIPLLAISPIVPVVAVSSVLRGYFQGRRHMSPLGISQIIEQVLRVCFSAILATALLPYGVAYAAAGAISANVIGEIGSLFYMFTMFKTSKKIPIRKGFWSYVKGGRKEFKELMNIALPATGSRLIGSVGHFFEPIIITQSLAIAGVSAAMATKLYGEIAGLALSFLTLPTFITYSLSVSLVPTISEAAAHHRYDQIHYRLHQAMKVSMITGGLAVVITYEFAAPLMKLMYDVPHVAVYVRWMAPFFFIYFFQQPLQAALQALNHAKAAMMNTVFGSTVKMATIFVLASQPEFQIFGAAMGYVVNVILVTLLHFVTVVKSVGYTLVAADFAKGLICIAITAFTAYYLRHYALTGVELLPRTLTLIFVVTIVYFLLIVLFGVIRKDDVAQLPLIGKWGTKFFKA